MDNSFVGFFQNMFNELQRLPLFHDHYDKLLVILGGLLAIYFVGSLVRNVLLGAAIIFLLWGFRYQDAGYSQHVNRYTGAVCDVARECWLRENSSNLYDRSYDRSSYR